MHQATFVSRVRQNPQERELVGWRGGEVDSGQGGHEPHLEGQIGVLLTTQQDMCLAGEEPELPPMSQDIGDGPEIGFIGWLQHSFIVNNNNVDFEKKSSDGWLSGLWRNFPLKYSGIFHFFIDEKQLVGLTFICVNYSLNLFLSRWRLRRRLGHPQSLEYWIWQS